MFIELDFLKFFSESPRKMTYPVPSPNRIFIRLAALAGAALAASLQASPAVYEGFDMTTLPAPLGSENARSGKTSQGWLSDWHIKEGTSRALRDDLAIDGLHSAPGLASSRGQAVVMRQLDETFSGDVYGSFRVRGGQLNPNSMLGLLIGLPDADPVNPRTALVSFLATRWGSGLGAILVGGRPVPVERGEDLKAGETVLVLWKIERLAEPGGSSNPVIQMWILNEAQASHFAASGMRERDLRRARLGAQAGQVMQYGRVELRGSRLTLIRGLVIYCFANGAGKADFDEIRISRESLADAAGVRKSEPEAAVVPARERAQPGSPNILFITLDDMNWDSMGAYGSKVANITPHMDSLAEAGMRFHFAYNQASNCVPSRAAYLTGRYPHTFGLLSFYNVDVDFPTLPEILRAHGYFTGCINKLRDSSLTNDFARYWDYHQNLGAAPGRDAATYGEQMSLFLDRVAEARKPFFCVVNIADPHKPFYDDRQSIEGSLNRFTPSVRYETTDVEIPGFLPQHPEIHEEIRNYYNSVKRGDDCVGAILATLRNRGLENNTVVILVSDHGMALPFAKSSLYNDGLRTPWVVRWPGTVARGGVDTEHLVSAINFLPTVLDIAGVPHPEGIHGKSVLPAIKGQSVDGLDRVYAEFNENAAGMTFPMRAIHTRRYAYIFNAWGTGNHSFRSDATWHASAGVMRRLSATDPEVAQRLRFLKHRTVEEFYDLEKDPFALNNLIDDPGHQTMINAKRHDMERWMRETNDYVLEAFLVRDDPAALDAFMERADAAALARAETLQWKRDRNRAGGTGRNTQLYKAR